MDFFEAQDESRRLTRVLLIFFLLAVVSIIVLTNLFLLIVLGYLNSDAVLSGEFSYDWRVFLIVAGCVVGLILLGSLFRIWSLSGGGARIAEMLSGKLIVDHGGDLKLRRLLNLVEEMAIASGTPVPPVYLVPDRAINAFAAGYTPGDAVIGVTQGALDHLSRDELQGVIAHEFSHILNGDMRLNIRLMGVLFGILMLAVVGRAMLSSTRHRTVRRRGSGGLPILITGAGLIVIGYVGKFFGGLIKAAVSRQREFLADASAVQFTRNPDGIGGALMRIGGYTGGTRLLHPEAEEYSHAFFCQGVTSFFSGLMATHPPLDERIMKINPRWDGRYVLTAPPPPSASEFDTGAPAKVGISSAAPIDLDAAIASFGQPTSDHLALAQGLIASMPAVLAAAAREPFAARAVVYLILLDSDELVSRRQQDHLAESADVFVMAQFRRLLDHAGDIAPEQRLPLLEMALPSLRQMSRDQYERFCANVEAMIRADNQIGLSEWALSSYLKHNLGAAFDERRTITHDKQLEDVREDCEVLLSMLAHSDRSARTTPETAFDAGQSVLEQDISLLDKRSLRLARLESAMTRLACLRPLRKPKLLKACMAVVASDGLITPLEKELVRAIADGIDCPMPPIR